MTKLVCECCGGAIDPITQQCEYCGTKYKFEMNGGAIHYIQTCPASLVPLRYQMEVPLEAMMDIPPDKLAEISMREMTRELAKALVPYIKLETERDPYTLKQIIRGTVRVVEPDFRF